MYPQDSFRSPYAAGGQGQEETLQDQIRYFIEDHGKKIVVLLILVVIGYFAWDFLVGSNRTITIDVKDTEGESLPADLLVMKQGDNNPAYSGGTGSITLKKGDYSVEITAAGFESTTESFSVGDNPEPQSFVLQKNLDVEIVQADFPDDWFAGQTISGTLELRNRGQHDFTIELVLEQDFKTLEDRGLTINLSPPTIVVPAGQTAPVLVEIQVAENISLRNASTGDTKTGRFRIKYLNQSTARKDISFTLHPALQLTVNPASLTKATGIRAGSSQVKIGDLRIRNNSPVAVENLNLSVQIDSNPNAASWFSFDFPTIDSINPNQTQIIQVYITPPINSNTVTLAGQSRIIIQNELVQKNVPLNITIQGVQTALSATLSATNEIILQQADDGTYPITTGTRVTLRNNGQTTIPEVELINYTASCRDNWIIFDQATILENLEPSQQQTISFRITAPPSAEPDFLQTCEFRVRYTDPLSGEEMDQGTTPNVLRIRTRD